MEILAKLFGGSARVKVIRWFLLNPDLAFDAIEMADRARIATSLARSEITRIENIGLVKKKSFFVEVEHWRGKTVTIEKRRTQGWTLNNNFAYLEQLMALMTSLPPLSRKEITRKFARVGKVKLIITSGVFIQEPESRVDLLIVGEGILGGKLDTAIRMIESEVGIELRYSALETEDFKYRVSVYDKLIRDILDFNHETIVDRLGLMGQGVS